jgi:hypothetical protein
MRGDRTVEQVQRIDEYEGFRIGDRVLVTTDQFKDPEGTGGVVNAFEGDADLRYVRVRYDEEVDGLDTFPYLPGELERRTFRVGDRVKVSVDAETSDGGPVYFGEEVVGTVTTGVNGEGDIHVRTDYGLGQLVDPRYASLLVEGSAEVTA